MIKRYADLFIAGVGFLVAVTLPLLIEVGTNTQELAIISLVVIVLQGVFFWYTKRDQAELLREVRTLLNHEIRNQLQILMVYLPEDPEQRDLALHAVERITESLLKLGHPIRDVRAEARELTLP